LKKEKHGVLERQINSAFIYSKAMSASEDSNNH